MATRQNTNNAIPSNDLKDLNDNTIIIDEWTNGTEDYTQDRLGNQIKTRKKVVEDLDAYAQQIADGLFVPLDGSKAATKVKIGTTTLTGDDGILKADDVKLLKDGDAVRLTADENGVKTVTEDTNFTGALQNKGSDVVTKAMNVAYVTETYLSDDKLSWYRKWSDGLIEQGGTVSGTGDSGTQTINLLVDYSNSNYIARSYAKENESTFSSASNLQNRYGIGMAGLTINIDNHSFYCSANYSGHWIARGY